jgi:ribosomal protein L16/L10AE
MKNHLIPSVRNDNIPKRKMSRSLVYSPRLRTNGGNSIKSNKIIYYIIAASSGILEMKHFTSCVKIITKGLRYTHSGKRKNMIKKCKLHSKVLNLSLSKKANGIRMGKGKGPIDKWVSHVSQGQILYSIERGVNLKLIEKPLLDLMYKLPIKISIVSKIH